LRLAHSRPAQFLRCNHKLFKTFLQALQLYLYFPLVYLIKIMLLKDPLDKTHKVSHWLPSLKLAVMIPKSL